MSEGKKQKAVVPRLRFSEFRENHAWKSSRLGDIATILKGKGISKADIVPDGDLPAIRYAELYTIYGEVIREVVSHTNLNANSLVLSKQGDVILPASGETKAEIATAATLLIGGVALGGDLNIIRSHLHGPFLSYYLNGSKRTDISKVAQGDTVAHLYPGQLEKITIHYPSPNEQRKIAECLYSLDELIAVEGRKLTTLRDHKKGLMQHLFPHEGETRPRLRFPEFLDAPEWEESTVGSKCKSFSGGTPDTTRKEFYNGKIPFIRSAEIGCDTTGLFLTEEGLQNSAAKLVKSGDVLIALYGANSGDVALARMDGAINQAILCLRPEGSKTFLYHYLTQKKAWILSTYLQGGQGNLSGEIVKSVTLQFPSSEEQEAVAECLSTLDTLIAAQAAKLNVLRTHKRGLMQRLFPTPEDTKA